MNHYEDYITEKRQARVKRTIKKNRDISRILKDDLIREEFELGTMLRSRIH